MTNDTTKTCRRCGGKLRILTAGDREYENCTGCKFTYPVISLIQS